MLKKCKKKNVTYKPQMELVSFSYSSLRQELPFSLVQKRTPPKNYTSGRHRETKGFTFFISHSKTPGEFRYTDGFSLPAPGWYSFRTKANSYGSYCTQEISWGQCSGIKYEGRRNNCYSRPSEEKEHFRRQELSSVAQI